MKKTLIACSVLALLVPVQGRAQDHFISGEARIVQPDDSMSQEKESFQRLDLDGDGTVSSREMAQSVREDFAYKDVDADGQVSLDEFQKEDEEDPDVVGGEDVQRKLDDVRTRRFERLDKNGDGVLSEDELLAEAMERHGWMDKDRDGYVALQEVDTRRSEAEAKAKRILEASRGFPAQRVHGVVASTEQ